MPTRLRDPQLVAKPTLIVVGEPAPWTLDAVVASEDPLVKPAEGDQPEVRYHEGAVTWTAQLTVPGRHAAGRICVGRDRGLPNLHGYRLRSAAGGEIHGKGDGRRGGGRRAAAVGFHGRALRRSGSVGCRPCGRSVIGIRVAAWNHRGLTPPRSPAAGGPDAASAPAGGRFSAARRHERADRIAAGPGLCLPGRPGLNVMPCVLPVIGLKVMAFVQQAGESRAKVLALNVWYSLGLMSVFLLLATLAAVWNVGWGQQFSSETVTITLAAIVFAMGLSFLGVWQMPIPGFVGSGSAVELAEKEGPAGAFMKGVLTTILATPCSGPGVAVALGYCTGKPASVVYMIFAMVGLGMASPYLLIGVFPKALRLLPRPGAWMERFEQIMGLVLLATVIYLLSFTAWANVLPTVTLLLGLGAACWWIGQIPFTADLHGQGARLAGRDGLCRAVRAVRVHRQDHHRRGQRGLRLARDHGVSAGEVRRPAGGAAQHQ